MSKSDHNNPHRSSASENRHTLFEFGQECPDDTACLGSVDCPTVPGSHFLLQVPESHQASSGGSPHLLWIPVLRSPGIPDEGTIFEGSATSVRLWFYAVYLTASIRCGISAKQLKRDLGVTYKTAWRMFSKIRSLLDQDEERPTVWHR